jgi:hypothetical protein
MLTNCPIQRRYWSSVVVLLRVEVLVDDREPQPGLLRRAGWWGFRPSRRSRTTASLSQRRRNPRCCSRRCRPMRVQRIPTAAASARSVASQGRRPQKVFRRSSGQGKVERSYRLIRTSLLGGPSFGNPAEHRGAVREGADTRDVHVTRHLRRRHARRRTPSADPARPEGADEAWALSVAGMALASLSHVPAPWPRSAPKTVPGGQARTQQEPDRRRPADLTRLRQDPAGDHDGIEAVRRAAPLRTARGRDRCTQATKSRSPEASVRTSSRSMRSGHRARGLVRARRGLEQERRERRTIPSSPRPRVAARR